MPILEDATARLKQTYAVLVADCQEVEKLLHTTDTPCLRRMFVRTLSAFVEGMAHQMRCIVRDALEEFPQAKDKCGFTDLEFEWLNGNKQVKKRLPTAMNCYAKLYLEPSGLSCQSKLDRLAKIRDRITHPESAAGLEVSDQEWTDAWAAAESLIEDMGGLFRTCNAKG